MAEWDGFWQRGDRPSALTAASRRPHPRIAAFWASLPPGPAHVGPRCIDLASGSGAVFACLPDTLTPDGAATWVALDISPAAVSALKRRFPGVAGLVADAANPPLEPRRFDIVTSQYGVEYAGPGAIAAAARLVGPGGRLALLVHSRPGRIYEECRVNLDAIDRLRAARVLPLAASQFAAGFKAIQAGNPGGAERARRRLRPAFRALNQSLDKHGEAIASGLPARLRAELGRIAQRLPAYDRAEVLGWLRNMRQELDDYRTRMLAMTNAALELTDVNAITRQLSAEGLRPCGGEPRQLLDGAASLGWIVEATRP